MLLKITKNTGKPHTLLYQRDDGSQTWMPADDFFVRHDLSHFALEKVMGYKKAFMGMLNKGMDIKDFEDRQKRKEIIVTREAASAENLANLFLQEIAQGRFDDFNKVANETFRTSFKLFDPPVLHEDQINETREYLRQLLHQWNQVPVGSTLTLSYEI